MASSVRRLRQQASDGDRRKSTGTDSSYQRKSDYHTRQRSYDSCMSRLPPDGKRVLLRIPQHSESPPFTSLPIGYEPYSFGSSPSTVLHDISEQSDCISLACSLPGDIHLLDDGVFVKRSERVPLKPRAAKSKKAKIKDLQAHRSKSLTQIDCLNSTASSMVRQGGCTDSETSPSARSTFYPDRLLVPKSPSSDEPNRTLAFRQKVPSQEYFSVTFDVLDESASEMVPAVKGILLRDALQALVDRRGLELSNIHIYPPSSNTPLSLLSDTYRLAGFNLHVKAKDDAGSVAISRANSTGSVPSNGSRFQPTSRSNSATSVRSEKKEAKKTSSGSQKGGRKNAMVPPDDLVLRKQGYIFSNASKTEKEKMEALTDLLNQYSQMGIPPLPGLLTFSHASDDAQSDPFYLEPHWSQIVNNHELLTKKKSNQQDYIWELLHTEVFYIKTIKVIIDIFLSCLCNLQSGAILNEIDTERMFSNITDIHAANQQFWVDHLLPMLYTSRNHSQLLNPIYLRDGFLKFEQIFQPYIKYCINLNGCIHYVKDNNKINELFKTYLAWCETQKDCEKLRLVDLLVKPMQRLTKYSLLLTAIHKNTDDEHTKKTLLEMNHKLNEFVCSVDATLRQRHEQERLSSIIGRIESYDAIETNNDEVEKVLKEYCTLDLTCPMPGCGNQQSRQLLMEGSGLKLRETSSSKINLWSMSDDATRRGSRMDVHCFLFTDMLLICKSLGKKGDKVRVIRQPYVVDRLVVQEMANGGLLLVYLNEYKVATAAFALYTADTKLWMDSIRKAQELYSSAKTMAASERQSLGFLRASVEEDEDYDFPSTALLVARSSSRSSLDISDPTSTASSTAAPITTSPMAAHPQQQSTVKAVSIELGELRNSSLSSDDGGGGHDFKVRSSSVETRVSVTVTSPRLERSTEASGKEASISLNVPYLEEQCQGINQSGATVIQVPLIAPPAANLSPTSRLSPRALQRTLPVNVKPPLVKTKNVAPEQQQQDEETFHDDEEVARRLNVKRACRTERRYHTADSIESLKKDERDTSIHKRLSWNCGQPPGPSERLLRNKHVGKCLSTESVYSSSGVSSTGCCSTDGDEPLSDAFISAHEEESSTDDIQIDVSEVKEGISSVQITVNGGRHHDDIRRLKRFLLSDRSVEASDV